MATFYWVGLALAVLFSICHTGKHSVKRIHSIIHRQARDDTVKHIALQSAFLPWVLGLVTALDFFDSAMFSFFAGVIATGVGASLTEYVWFSSGYAVAAILGILQQAWWVERLGHRRYIAFCMGLYAIAGLCAALSQNPVELLLARSAQGYFIAPMLGACRIILQTCYTAAERPKAIRAFLILMLLGAAVAPLAGGLLVPMFGWRALFASTMPLAMVCAALAWHLVPASGDRPPHERGAAHFWPYLVFAFAQAALQIVLLKLRQEVFMSSPETVLLALLCGAALLWFGWQQWRHPTPLLRLHALGERHFLSGLVLFVFYYFLSTAFGYLLPRVLETGLGFTLERSANLIGLTSLAAAPALFVYFAIARRVRRRKFIIVGGFILALAAALWMTRIPADAGAGAVLGPLVLRGLLTLFMVLPVASVTFTIFSHEDFAHGYRLKNIVRQMAISLAMASIIAFEQHSLALHHSQVARQAHLLAFNDAFYFLAVVALCGGLFAAWQTRID